ncbi:hypothetical protein CE195_03160 [Sodalis-like symbiont of Philaenus spumarius]|nr:hypothetical protein CE195_03160 [Sodalis-like symbiont of Philaenus spumarius]
MHEKVIGAFIQQQMFY